MTLIVGSSGIKARLAKKQGHKCPCKLVDGCYMTIELIVNSCQCRFYFKVLTYTLSCENIKNDV